MRFSSLNRKGVSVPDQKVQSRTDGNDKGRHFQMKKVVERRGTDARDQIINGLERAEREILNAMTKSLRIKWGDECRLATINANGLKDASRKDALAAFMLEFFVDICVVTETHLRLSDINNVKKHFLDFGYQVGAQDCRNTGAERIKGGVIILVRFGISHMEKEEAPLPAPPIDACSVSVLTTDEEGDGVRITGMYCPPIPTSGSVGKGEKEEKKKVKYRPSRERVQMVWSRGHSEGVEGQFCGHLVVGDLNPTSWKDGYQRWLADGGARELSDPRKRTHKRGGALDKMLFQP